MITAIVLYDLPKSIGLEECRAHFTRIAPDFLKAPGFLRKQFICRKEGDIAGGVYMWENQAAAEAFYAGPGAKAFARATATIPASSILKPWHSPTKATGKAVAV
jgi:quinol monooxygenase YgiN